MCGIAGIFSSRHAPAVLRAAADSMQQALVHRGPDDQGLWQSPCGQVVLAHRRLSILDLSAAGRQPMTTPDGRFTLCFNGEIYNFRELRASLESQGVTFTTQTDTEVILRLYERDGSQCINALRGMFALALWDAQERTALLARDPLGIKPLYFHQRSGTLAFASELKALCHSGIIQPTLNATAVQRFFETGSVPEPLTLVNEVQCLEAGQTLEWRHEEAHTHRYWQINFDVATPPPEDPVQTTRDALIDSVRHHFVSDVPVGIFLSGGIDSTALLALANVTGHQGISAFSISVDDAAADESPIARRTAEHFSASYNEMRLDATVARGLFTQFLQHMDQPSVDGLNTFTVSTLARQVGMKVVLSGLGGDELFAGYASFRQIPSMRRWHQLLHRVGGAAWLLDHSRPQHRRMAHFLRSKNTVPEAFTALRGIFSVPEAAKLTQWVTGQSSPRPPEPAVAGIAVTIADQISMHELTRYMRNQLLRDSDVMSMANGLELRVPLVDHKLVDTVSAIPSAQRLQQGKRLLTQAVPEIPDWVVNQPKRGFLFPYQKWLGTEWGESFAQVTQGSPVPMTKWYQQWSLFVLRHCMTSLNLT